MNKQQVVWLIIRLVGVYFAYLTIVSLLGLVGAIPALFTLPKIEANTKNANVAANSNSTFRVQPISPNGNSNTAESTETNGKTDESITDKFKGENFKTFAWFLILTIFYGVAAWYLLRDGRVLFDILNREKPDGFSKEKNAEVTTLNLSDKQN
jgi:septal ring-binding cell division protein DamX